MNEMYMTNKDARIYVAGHNGLVGSALVRKLKSEGFSNLILYSASQLDLCNQQAVQDFFVKERPEYVFLAAAKVGGIQANIDYPAEFIYDNMLIAANVIHAAYIFSVKKLLFLGSSCIYPRGCPQPIKEEYLLSNVLEKTNEPYAIAKIAGIKLCQAYRTQYGVNFITCMPTNLYGPHDNFNVKTSHVLPALIAKFCHAKRVGSSEVVVWGTGKPYREFLYVDDLADAVFFLMQHYDSHEIINIGTGIDISIKELAQTIKDCIGYQGSIVFDSSKPDGTPQKLLNVDKLSKLGWKASTSLNCGIKKTVGWCNEKNIF